MLEKRNTGSSLTLIAFVVKFLAILIEQVTIAAQADFGEYSAIVHLFLWPF